MHARTFLTSILLILLLPISAAWAQLGPHDFTIIALPDTQNYSQYYPQIFNAQTDWIVKNQANLKIPFVLGLGDIVNNGSSVAQQSNADASIRLLDNAHIPYLLALGNHDYENASPKTRNVTTFNRYFGPARYAGESWYRGNFPVGSNENFYGVFNIDGKPYLVMALEFYPRNSVLTWASSIIGANLDKQVILILHSFLNTNSRRVGFCDGGSTKYFGITQDNDGEEMWSKLMSKHRNIIMVLNGHFHGWGHRADLGDNGNLVNQLLADYQNWPNGGGGYLRILTFRPLLNRVEVKTYSPYYNKYLTDSANQFSMPLYNTTPGLRGTGTVAGRVRSAVDCHGLSGVKITSPLGSTTTNAAGSFTLTAATPVKSDVTASAAGWTSSTKSVKVDTGYAAQLDLYLSPTGIVINSPASGATVASPVEVIATATSTQPITTVHIYVDNELAYSNPSTGGNISTPLQLASGSRYLVVQAWDKAGTVFKKSVTVTVK